MLGSNFITGLLKEKALAEELINADSQTTLKIQELKHDGAIIRENETRKQRKNRHMRYLKHLMSSENEQMKRKLQDLIDHIFTDEKSALDDDLKRCYDDIKRWESRNKEPVNFDVIIINKLNNLLNEQKSREQTQDQMAACNTVEAQKDRLMGLSDICTQFGMKDIVNDKKPMTNL